jgi:hypothetical protein
MMHDAMWVTFTETRCRSDGSFVAAFSAVGADPFEVELTVWEDAD